jgi:hypothetical protein
MSVTYVATHNRASEKSFARAKLFRFLKIDILKQGVIFITGAWRDGAPHATAGFIRVGVAFAGIFQ